ncbi:unnamed protein product [Schistocephalus solidus]|uniref:Noggin n=1 Tax=Schistocephalus solidus TaxID=70667 RepID=A0A183SE91_SCHSO|nr:unnamed protein product [Schistocephalus solidus]
MAKARPGMSSQQSRSSIKLATDEVETKTGGRGLSISSHTPISLGHLTKNLKDTPLQHPLNHPSTTPSSMLPRWSNKPTMRVMGQAFDDPTISRLHPDLNSRHFRRLWNLLRSEEDRHWTSEEPPRVLRQRGVPNMMSDAGSPQTAPVDVGLLRKANSLNLTFRDQTGAQFLLPEPQIQLFRNWLIEQATCEMDFIWKDLGSLYWPRWIRMGVCLSRLGSSCSWPPGMKCQPSGSRVLRLLNWNCEDAVQSSVSAGDPTDAGSVPLQRRARAIINLPGHLGSSLYARSPVINLRAHLQHAKVPPSAEETVTPQGSHRSGFQRAPRSYANGPHWRYYSAVHRRKGRRDVELTAAEEEERKSRKAKRLMRKLSVTSNGFHCYWQVQKYLISDKCTCSCA